MNTTDEYYRQFARISSANPVKINRNYNDFEKRKIVHKVFQRAGEYFYVCNQVVNIKQGKYTTNNKLVTCERCLKIMKKKVKINE